MLQRVRCPHCHRWTDALLVWAAGDCCPTCNASIAGFGSGHEQIEAKENRALHEPGRIAGSGLGRLGKERGSVRQRL